MNLIVPEGQNSDYEEKLWADEIKYRDHLEFLRTSQMAYYDRAVLMMSSGGLGLSVLLLSELVKAQAKSPILLLVSWVAFGLSIIFNIGSNYLGALSASEDLDELDRQMKGEEVKPKRINFTGDMTMFTTVSAGVFFVIGAIFLLWFAYANIIGVPNVQQG